MHEKKYPIGASVLRQDFYVDDMLTGADTLAELNQKKTEVTKILQLVGLSLSKWNSNHLSLQTKQTSDICIDFEQDSSVKTLGTVWNVHKDTFCFKLPPLEYSLPTKRSVLSTIARIFDILGLLSPVVIRLKIFLQEMWIKTLFWDEELPIQLKDLWFQLYNDLLFIYSISVPRYVFTSSETKIDIHGFADASQRAYGCCLYVKATLNNCTKVTLLIAKSKVAPLKAQSLPRLELCALPPTPQQTAN